MQSPPGETPSSSDLTSIVYRALVKDSVLPADPRVVANAALAALARIESTSVQPLPDGFGADAEQDAAWLAQRVASAASVWPIVEAMAWETGIAHVGLREPKRAAGMMALMSGTPLSNPGFNVYRLADGRFAVFDVVEGASAHASGLEVGDVLVRVDGEPATRANSLLLPFMSLPAGAEVKLDIERAGRHATIPLRLAKSDVAPVVGRMLDDGLAYVRLRWFAKSEVAEHDTAALARRAFESLASEGARGLVLDLRSCFGGNGTARVVAALCDGDIAYASMRGSQPLELMKRDGAGRSWPDRPVVVLVNDQTISAPEILALAARELGHAKIIGVRTAGGLTASTYVKLDDQHALMIPTGAIVGPVTRTALPGYQVAPDVEVSNPSIDELMSGTDRQLDAARSAIPRDA